MRAFYLSFIKGLIVAIVCGMLTSFFFNLPQFPLHDPTFWNAFEAITYVAGFAYLIVGWPIASLINYLTKKRMYQFILHILFGTLSLFIYVFVLTRHIGAIYNLSTMAFMLAGSLFSILYFIVNIVVQRILPK